MPNENLDTPRRETSGTAGRGVPGRSATPRATLGASPRVLVASVVPSLAWGVTRSLALAGHKPVLLGWGSLSPLRFVPDCTYRPLRNIRYVNGELDAALIEEIEAACAAHRIDVVMAADYPTTVLLADHGQGIRSARLTALPEAGTMRTLHDKWEFSRTLQRLGIPQPGTEIARDADALAATRLPFPVITKPVDMWASVGFQVHHDRAALHHAIEKMALGADFPLLVQDFIPGKDVGLGFIARHGRIVAHAAFEKMARGVRRYFDAPALLGHVEALVRDAGYHGVGEVDARYDPARDEYRLLEINPRFWASMLYATRAGMNFPDLLLRLDELGDGPGFAARPEGVRLSPYDHAVGRGALMAATLHHRLLKLLESR